MATKTSDLIKKSQAKRGAPGTLKRKVKGKMTLAKARALKNRPGATTLDKKQANFFINMHSEENNPRIPRKKGQPAGSDKHSDLYTDENPKGTIKGLKFTTVDDAKASVNKIKNSGKAHAHKIQAAVAMEQRARVAGKASAAAVYRKFINAMKEKTKQKNESLLINLSDHDNCGTPDCCGECETAEITEDAMTAADAGIPQDTKNMGPRLPKHILRRRTGVPINVTDRRRKKTRTPVLLKRFRSHMNG